MKITTRIFVLIIVLMLFSGGALEAQLLTPTPERQSVDLLFSVDATVPALGAALQDTMRFLIDQLEISNVDWRIAVRAVRGDAVTTVQSYTNDRGIAADAFGRIGTDQEAEAGTPDFVPRGQATQIEMVVTSNPSVISPPASSTKLCILTVGGAVVPKSVLQTLQSCPSVFDVFDLTLISFQLDDAIDLVTGLKLPSVFPTACNEMDNPNLRVRVFATDYDLICSEFVRNGAYLIYKSAIPNQRVIDRNVLQAYELFAFSKDPRIPDPEQFDPPIEACLKGQGTLYFMSNLKKQPQAQRPPSTDSGDGFICTSLSSPGVLALVAG